MHSVTIKRFGTAEKKIKAMSLKHALCKVFETS